MFGTEKSARRRITRAISRRKRLRILHMLEHLDANRAIPFAVGTGQAARFQIDWAKGQLAPRQDVAAMGIRFQAEPVVPGGHQPRAVSAGAATDIHHRSAGAANNPGANWRLRLLVPRAAGPNHKYFRDEARSRSRERRPRRRAVRAIEPGTSRTGCSASVLETPSLHETTIAQRGIARLASGGRNFAEHSETEASRTVRVDGEQESRFAAAARRPR